MKERIEQIVLRLGHVEQIGTLTIYIVSDRVFLSSMHWVSFFMCMYIDVYAWMHYSLRRRNNDPHIFQGSFSLTVPSK